MNFNYKKKLADYDLVLNNIIVGRLSVRYIYTNDDLYSRKIEFIPYPSLFETDELSFFRDNHWKLEDETILNIVDEAGEILKIEELIYTVVIKGLSKRDILMPTKKRDGYDFEIFPKTEKIEFWLMHEFYEHESPLFTPAKRVYQKGGYYVMGFEHSKDNAEIIDAVRSYFSN